MESVVSELEGTLIKERDPFSYLMLVAFEASGLIRFALLLMLWPLIRVLEMVGEGEMGMKLMIFVAVAGVREAEIESVARAVLPKFYVEDVDLEAWKVFNSCGKRVVVTKQPRIMVETFLRKHLGADMVLGTELVINRFGFATGFTKGGIIGSTRDRVARMFLIDEKPSLGLGRVAPNSFLSLCNEQKHPPFLSNDQSIQLRPVPVIFHDGRLVQRPTPATALLIILWIPVGIILGVIRILVSVMLPMWAVLPASRVLGIEYVMRGKPPGIKNSGVLFVCTHRTLVDPIALSIVLGRKVASVTYSLSKVSEILSPINTIRLARNRDIDAGRMRRELGRGDLAVCPEGTTCREPFLLRFSALFAELTDRIVPVAMNYRSPGGFFHATTARGWKGLDILFYAMNPRTVYEVTFLDQLPREATCSSANTPQDVANHVQTVLAATLGFQCTNFTRKDKYRVLAGNDGTVLSYTSILHSAKKAVITTFNSYFY